MKPRYRLNTDGSTSLLVCNGDHFNRLASRLPAQLTGVTINRNKDPEEAKRRLYAEGVTLTQFAEKHGFKYRTVSEVVRGVNKALYGEGHRVAVALGIK